MRREMFHAVITAAITVCASARAQTYYVSTNGNDTANGASWLTAKRTIQAAINMYNAAEVVVTNGTYAPISTVGKAILVRSVEGAGETVIDGGGARCATLGSSSYAAATLDGFTLRDGVGDSPGGGGACYGTLLNCVLTNNAAGSSGYGGGAYDCVLTNCVLTGNSAHHGGGAYRGKLVNCTLADNIVTGNGGGANMGDLENCTLTGNSATGNGGGAVGAMLDRCVLSGNTADYGGGAYQSTLGSCLLFGNTAANSGGGTSASNLKNCTLSRNRANGPLGGGGSYDDISVVNSIVWGNTAAIGGTAVNYVGGTFDYSCTLPDLGGTNIGEDPLFADRPNNDFHLRPGSPCLNAGDNTAMPGDYDLDGHKRIIGDTVDMGAYENVLIYYVSADSGDDDNDGMSWFAPKKSIQAAINIAAPYREIRVAKGTYDPIVTGGKALTILGEGGAEQTIIDGLLKGGRCATLGLPFIESYLHDNFGDTVLEGFTLRNGVANVPGGDFGDDFGGDFGGGAYGGRLYNCVLTNNTATDGGGAWGSWMSNCVIVCNVATNDGGGVFRGFSRDCTLTENKAGRNGGGVGGKIWFEPDVGTAGGAPWQINCTLTGNKAVGHGGASYNGHLIDSEIIGNEAGGDGGGAYDEFNHTSYLHIRCTFTENKAGRHGGGVYRGGLLDCIIIGNEAGQDGGGACNTPSSLDHTRCTFMKNKAGRNGGGVYGCDLLNCTLVGNSAEQDGGGGAGGCTLTDCVLEKNTAGRHGGGFANWGTLTRCIIRGNTAVQNGGGAGKGGSMGYLVLRNCLVTFNEAEQDGGGAYDATLFNCTLLKNTAMTRGGGVADCTLYNCIAVDNELIKGDKAEFDHSDSWFTFSCTSKLNDPIWDGGGNLFDQDPCFVSMALNNYRLQQAISPCIDAGNNDWTLGAGTLEIDLDGNPRILNGGHSLTVDMGCYESFGSPNETSTTPVPVPHDWLDEYFEGLETPQDYEDAANAPGENGIDVWESYYAGLDPTDPDSKLRITLIEAEGGVATRLEWFPDLRPDRQYEIGMKEDLTAPTPAWLWMPPELVPMLAPKPARFFKVRIVLP
ncbi:MAG: hypothetical protein FWG50_09775 [Kiritimatiellaeota bacterium]|nr:hypothetical protein [Kiritimatiellota bacterium]